MESAAELIARGAALLRNGGVVAFPTETVYGLGANALDPVALARVYEIKGRPRTSPLIVHVSSIAMARAMTAVWPEQAETLAREFWPGPLTLVLPKSAVVPMDLTAGLETVGIRMPAHPVALSLIEQAGVPVAAPSANRFMALSPTSADQVRQGLGAAVDLILEGGVPEVGIESTVLSLVEGTPLLLRPGMISRADIEECIGLVRVAEGSGEGAHPSPGMHERHYAPRTPLYLVGTGGELPRTGRGVFLYSTDSGEAENGVAMPGDAQSYARLLYGTLHRLDGEGWDWIGVERPSGEAEWAGILDRLQRASIR